MSNEAPIREHEERTTEPPEPPDGLTHVSGFDRLKTLCGKRSKGSGGHDWINSRESNLIECVVCVDLLDKMSVAEKKALNIFWGGDGKKRPGTAA